jgi:uncharacterized protein (TIGR02466 family)
MPLHQLFSSPVFIYDIPEEEQTQLRYEVDEALKRISPKLDTLRHQVKTTFDIKEKGNDMPVHNLKGLAVQIWAAMTEYWKELGCPTRELELNESWFNIYSEGQFMFDHEHPGSVVSGVYYHQVPEDSGGDFYFRSPVQTMHNKHWPADVLFDYQQFRVEPKVGRIILFPSWLTHSVMPVTGPEDKISISFNIGNPVTFEGISPAVITPKR